MNVEPARGQRWKHLKTGHIYRVIKVVINSTNDRNGQKMVEYRVSRPAKSETVFVREISEFQDKFTPVA